MKTKWIFLLLPALLALSCDLLEEHPKDQLEESKIITGPKSLYLATLGDLYAHFGSDEQGEGLMGTTRGIYDLNTFTTDEAMIPVRGADWYDGGLWLRLYLHAWESGDAPIKNAWSYLYRMVVKSNQALARLERYHSLLTEDERDLYEAEIRAIRAYMYMYLLDLFARVPIVTDERTPLSEVKQSERSEVFNFVRNELEAVLPELALERSNFHGAWYGRITRPVAFTLLARLCLNADVYLDDDWTDGIRTHHPEMYQRALDYCDSITSLSYKFRYELTRNLLENFVVDNENSTENIFVIPLDPQLYPAQFQYLFRSLHYDHAAALGMSGENGASATLEVLEANGYGTSEEDPRFELNYWGGLALGSDGNPVVVDGVPLEYKPAVIELDLTGSPFEKVAGARMRKYAPDPNGREDGKLVKNDIVLLRYADILLMRAEAMARLGQNGTALLNVVRARSEAPLLTREATLDDILKERLIELCWEGCRRTDLIRFGKFTQARSFRPVLDGEENGYTTVFPIPADVLAVNKKLEQNKGYD